MAKNGVYWGVMALVLGKTARVKATQGFASVCDGVLFLGAFSGTFEPNADQCKRIRRKLAKAREASLFRSYRSASITIFDRVMLEAHSALRKNQPEKAREIALQSGLCRAKVYGSVLVPIDNKGRRAFVEREYDGEHQKVKGDD